MKRILIIFFFYSTCLSVLFPNETHKAGFIDIDHGKLYYILFASRDGNQNAPLVLWLTGGPGCSSMVANYYENGPYLLGPDGKTRRNPYSWNTNVDLIYVDEPVGTGFSSAKGVHFATNENDVAFDFYQFLTGFFKLYPEYNKRPFYITGESYAGHYIPAISSYLVDHPNPNINLIGVAIGNGLVNAYEQYPAYATFLYENHLLSRPIYEIGKIGFQICQTLIKYIGPISILECQVVVAFVMQLSKKPNFNVYDISKKCEVEPGCYDMSALNFLLADPEVRKDLNAGKAWWTECATSVHLFLSFDWMYNLTQSVFNLVNHNIKVLAYSGERDFICNWRGGEAWTNAMVWKGQEEFAKQPYKTWKFINDNYSTTTLGEYKIVDNFAFLKVSNAGHMVPMDSPESALYMLKKFLDWDIGG